MADVHTPEQRRFNMSQIKSRDTKPEFAVRRMIHSMGYRYRLHQRDLPGCPDLVFPSRKKIIFVHGCFWHQHNCKRGLVNPKTNSEYWSKKINANVDRDAQNEGNLKELGWDILVLWECEIKELEKLRILIRGFLGD